MRENRDWVVALIVGSMVGIVMACAAIMLVPRTAHASEVTLGYGVNPVWQDPHARTVVVGIENPIYENLWERVSYGHWFESGPGASGDLVSYSLGTRVEYDPLYASLYWGVGYCPNPDYYWLSGHVQFVNDVGFGVMRNRLGLGFHYRHVSDGPIQSLQPGPNRGRDFFPMFEVRWAL